jgi:hypothetical protein
MFFEDCVFDVTSTTGNIADAEYGGHYVFRYNDVRGGGVFCHGITSNGERGTRLLEVYQNRFNYDGTGAQDPAIRLRGGTAVVWGNAVTGGWTTWSSATIMIDSELQRFGDDIGDGNQAVANGTGSHNVGSSSSALTDSSKNWTSGAFVGWTVYNLTDGSRGKITANTATTVSVTLSGGVDNRWDSGDSYKITNGYPLRDQPGRGKDAAFWTWGEAGPAQALEPMYEWDNTRDGVPVAGFTLGNNSGGWIQEGRDVISGTRKPGYTPYTYPHPLRGTSSGGEAPSATPPSNAKVNISTN